MRFLLFPFLLCCSISVLCQNNIQIQDVVNAVKRNPRKATFTTSEQYLIKLDNTNTEDIEIYKDGINNTKTGYGLHINITRDCVVRHAGEWDGLCGVIDTYYSYEKYYIDKAISLINLAHLYLVANVKPLIPSKGTTQVRISKGGKEWLILNDSPYYRNYKGDFHKLVEQLIELVGGEPEYGEPSGNAYDEYLPNDDIDTEIDYNH